MRDIAIREPQKRKKPVSVSALYGAGLLPLHFRMVSVKTDKRVNHSFTRLSVLYPYHLQTAHQAVLQNPPLPLQGGESAARLNGMPMNQLLLFLKGTPVCAICCIH